MSRVTALVGTIACPLPLRTAKDISKKDDKTIIIALKEPFGPLIDQLAKPITSDWRRVITRRAMKAPATPTIPIVTRSVLQPIRPTATRPGTAGLRAMSSRRCPAKWADTVTLDERKALA